LPYADPEVRAAYRKEYYAKNAEKAKARTREYYRDNRDAVIAYERSRQLKRRYGITVEDYDRMLEGQGGVCALCKETCSKGTRLCVDHDHDSGRVRGLLCDSCNRGLGRAEAIGLDKINEYVRGGDANEHC
jgi:hypothetical protein